MVAGEADLPEAFPGRLHIPEILPGDGRQADDGVHGGADVMGHGGEKVGFCLACLRRFPGGDLKALVQLEHVEQVPEEQNQQTGGNDPGQQPVFGFRMEVRFGYQAQQTPAGSGRNGGVGKDAVLPVRVEHGNGSGR